MILAQASGTGGGVIGLGVTGFLVGDGDIGEGAHPPVDNRLLSLQQSQLVVD